MSDIIRIHYQTMREIKATFEQEAERVQRIMNGINHHLAILKNGGWKSDAATRFYQEMDNDVCPSIKRLHDALVEAGAVTYEIIAIMKAAEEEAAGHLPIDSFSPQHNAGVLDDRAKSPAYQYGGENPRPDITEEFADFRDNRVPYINPIVGYPRDPTLRSIAEFFGYYRNDITELEADIMDELSLFQLNDLNNLHDEAFEVEREVFGNHSNNDGIADAFRHAY